MKKKIIKYEAPEIKIVEVVDVITTSPIDTDDEYEGEMDWNML